LGWKVCECSLHRICVDAVATDGFFRVARWPNGYRHVWPLPTYIPYLFWILLCNYYIY